MIIFDIEEKHVQLAARLSGDVLSKTPNKYAFIMDYWEYTKLSYIYQSCHFSSVDEQSTMLSMVAASLMATRSSHYPVGCWIMICDNPFFFLWIADKMDTKYACSIVDAVIKSSMLIRKERSIVTRIAVTRMARNTIDAAQSNDGSMIILD